ncbi:MAG: DNA primase [Nitrospirota bacterium]|nr:MAG: DNA primase [Nitrospirota bacterium]
MIDNNISDEIKSRLDIVDVISDYADLKKAGSNFKGLCPFHSEKTPSFVVSPQKQIFHCFGCNAGGDIFGFIMRYENVTFPEALETLAKRAGVEFKRSYSSKGGKQNDALYRINEDAALFYSGELNRSKKATGYLKERGLDEDIIKAFRLGYAPQKYGSLLDHLKSKGHSEAQIEKAGLIKYSEKKKAYDMFRGRLIFPICDISGKVIAFGGRIMDTKDAQKAPKYINSPETPVFKKSYTLYGLNEASRAIREKDYVIVAEGYTDVIVCHQYGFKNTVAPLGTALTEGHLKRLRSHTKKLLLVFDGDEAGLMAAKRSMHIIYENGLRGKVLLMPKGEDPDSLLNKKGADGLQKLFPGSKDLVDFFMEMKGDRIEIIRELIEISAKVPDAILRGELVSNISQRASISDIFLTEEVQKFRKKSKKPAQKRERKGVLLPEEQLAGIIFTRPDLSKEIINKLNTEDIEKNPLKNILLSVKEMGKVPPLDNLNSFFTEDESSYITSITIEPGFDEEMIDQIVDDCVAKIRQRKIARRIEELDQHIKIADEAGEHERVEALQKEKNKLKREASR